MSSPSVAVFLDKYHPRLDGNCKVSIRITFERIKRYYPTNITMKVSDFEKIMNSARRRESEKTIYNQIQAFEVKANEIIKKLSFFTFNKFEELYFENRNTSDSIYIAFDKYIKILELEDRIGTASSYRTARNSLFAFNKGLRFGDINKQMLLKYEKWLIDNGKSETTVGIYIRPLRAIFNANNIDKSLYPFGIGRDKYTIPKGNNFKKALKLEEVEKIFNYCPISNSKVEMARDYWIFIYLCNGINVKDLCLLKRKNIKENVIEFVRSKTQRTKKNNNLITISLKNETLEIIKKWGQISLDPDSYIFPHLKKGLTATEERKIYQQLTKTINKYIERICGSLGIKQNVTTYTARHSFATILRNSGAPESMIGDALGHGGNSRVTKDYFAGFNEEIIHKATDSLLAFSI
jgi:integrase/recombinase XerD